jgi:amidophosphoribosyltransferase
LGVDSLGYLSRDGMLRAAGGDPADFCHACFSGDYPTEIPAEALAGARHAAPLHPLTV